MAAFRPGDRANQTPPSAFPEGFGLGDALAPNKKNKMAALDTPTSHHNKTLGHRIGRTPPPPARSPTEINVDFSQNREPHISPQFRFQRHEACRQNPTDPHVALPDCCESHENPHRSRPRGKINGRQDPMRHGQILS